MGYWGVIERAVADRLTTADLWSDIRDAADELGLESPGVTVRGVNELRRLANTIQNSGRQFERATDETGLDARMMGEAPWSRPLAEQNALGIYQVRYQHTYVTAEGPQTEWRTSVFNAADMPDTVGELRDAIGQDAQQLADKYGVSHVEFGSVQILSV